MTCIYFAESLFRLMKYGQKEIYDYILYLIVAIDGKRIEDAEG